MVKFNHVISDFRCGRVFPFLTSLVIHSNISQYSFFLLTASILCSSVSVVFLKKIVYWSILLVLFVLSTDSLLCDMLVTFGSFVSYIK